jgi:hypothetical protein
VHQMTLLGRGAVEPELLWNLCPLSHDPRGGQRSDSAGQARGRRVYPDTKTFSDHPKEVDDMASSRIIEEESGTYYARPRHPHNGYYAGDFSGQPLLLLTYRNGQYQTTAVRSVS